MQHAAKNVRFPNRKREMAGAHRGRHGDAFEFGFVEENSSRREPEIKIEALERLDVERRLVPVAAIGVPHRETAGVTREVGGFAGERSLHERAVTVARQRETALGTIAVELDGETGEREPGRCESGLGLERERAEAARCRWLDSAPGERRAQGI